MQGRLVISFPRMVNPPQDREAIQHALTRHKGELERQDKVLEKVNPASGNMSLVSPVKAVFDQIQATFPGLAIPFNPNSVSVEGLRLQIASALSALNAHKMEGMTLDPWGPILGVLFEDGSSDYILEALQRAGVPNAFGLTPEEAYSHKTRKRAFINSGWNRPTPGSIRGQDVVSLIILRTKRLNRSVS
jgi:hypothetical protein